MQSHTAPNAQSPPADDAPRRIVVAVSDAAFQFLISRAEHFEYVRHAPNTPAPQRKPRGVSEYIGATLRANPVPEDWLDHRPPWMQQASEYRIDPDNDSTIKRARREEGLHTSKLHSFPLWWSADTTGRRISRILQLSVIPMEIVHRIVIELAISNPKRFNFDFAPSAMLGNLLEAWGQQNVEPAYDPPKCVHSTLKAYPRHVRTVAW